MTNETDVVVQKTIASWNTITVCGMKGTGKTTLERVGLIPQYQRVLIFDTDEEFQADGYPTYVPKSDNPMELDHVAKQIWKEGNCCLVVSEAEIYLPVSNRLPTNIFKIITRGRRRNIGLIADTRRIANLNKTVFGLSEHCFVFRHFSPTDVRYLQGFISDDCRKLASLADYWYWWYTRGNVRVCEPLVV